MQICKYFLDAVENSKYGWFWQCPNGGKNCMYRHALPPGFVLKKVSLVVCVHTIVQYMFFNRETLF